jgi:hypothetical protein
MARIAMGVGTSHGPLLNTPPLEWDQRARADRISKELIYRGESYGVAALKEARGREFLAALMDGDREFLGSLHDAVLRSGTSELVDYQPCYRSQAGGGCAMAFVTWGDGQ